MYYARYRGCLITSSCNLTRVSTRSQGTALATPETRDPRLNLLYSHVRALLYTLLYTITRTFNSIINVYMYTPALHAILSQRVVARASPLESHSPCAPPCISLVALTESSLIRSRRNLVKRSEKKFHDERVRFERVRRARRVAVCGFRKSLIHPTVLVGWENV